MSDSTPLNPPLSAEGRARRDQMLTDLTARMTAVHHARRTRRRVAMIAVPLLLITSALVLARLPVRPAERQAEGGSLVAASQPSPVPSAHGPAVAPALTAIEVVRTNASIIDSCRVRTNDAPATIINDDQLLTALASISRPAGLVRSDGRTYLTQPVTDEVR